jgi:hypothetical protein
VANEPQLPPAGYVRYASVTLCGNRLHAVGVLFQIGDRQPLWIGRSAQSRHPQVWLWALLADGSWVEVVRASVTTRPSAYAGPSVNIIQDAVNARTVVLAGTVIVVDAIGSADQSSVDIPLLDLRPLGLNIFGNTREGLRFGGTRYASNTFINVETAFGTSTSTPTRR